MTDTAVATQADTGAALAEQVVIKGDLSKLTELDRMRYYSEVCRSLGLNPLTRPFEYISLNGKLTLYATRAATDQLRSLRGITITSLDPRQVGDLFVVVATGRDRTGREDSSTGAVTTVGLRGEALANAMMKAETKAKRRLTLSLAGLGMSDETEVDSIPGAERVETPRLTLAERAAEKRAEIETPAEPVSEEPPAPAGLTRMQFVSALEDAAIEPKYAAAVRREMFPDATTDLSDAERGQLLAALLKDVVPAESEQLFTEGEWAPTGTATTA